MSRITTGLLPGPAGDLEYLLDEWTAPEGATARRGGPVGGAVVCHPHPLFGGTLHSRTVFHVARALAAAGRDVLRFNFRGVGRSAGVYDQGFGEAEDLRAALDWMAARGANSAPGPAPDNPPLLLAGFSFGAMVSLRYLQAHADARVRGLIAVGAPTRHGPLPSLLAWSGPVLLVSGDQDEYATVEQLEALRAALSAPADTLAAGHVAAELKLLAGADHYLTGRYAELAAVVQGWPAARP